MGRWAWLIWGVVAVLWCGCPTTDDDDDDDGAVDCPRGEAPDGEGGCAPLEIDGVVEEEVSFSGGGGDLTLEGTLTLPDTDDAEVFPGVVLIHGSGPQGRDEESSGQLMMDFGKTIPVFAQLAEALAAEGFAVLRYDKRTCHPGNGCDNDYPTPSADVLYSAFVEDAAAAVAYLADRDEVRDDDVTPVGHSQGGCVAPYVARDQAAARDVVLLAGAYRPIDEILVYQAAFAREALEELGYTQGQIDDALADLDQANEELAELRAGTFVGDFIWGASVEFWLEWFADGDGLPEMMRELTDQGVFVLQGGYDLNVPPEEAWAFAEHPIDNGDFQMTIVDDVTHPLVRVNQPDWTQITPADIEDHVDDELLDALVEWLLR